ncbi:MULTISPECIES: DUF6208 family protein [unclassified Coleofasciculus]|uniref:DUF6208 family protein n=1 Tax=unclassified Coleofasciculus TaxID=2692782 RepID=UPI0018830BED|nr:MULTISPECIES: DUF6208 family protein [unclassified Coleofasciculus]MBE9128141.1 hypothetical protein [Coleofasciculus sp. LEGE 07081]MBE9147947.1 hypothetical protein [Coleofasciculus sp. LEGE 07092]
MAVLKGVNSFFEILWEIPLAVLSLLFSRLLRFVMQSLSSFYLSSNPQQTPQWQLVSADFLAKPIKLLWAMSRARWNLHAIVAIVGPLEVKESISLDIQAAHKSAPSWTVVIYTPPNFKTITSISSLTISPSTSWETIKLQPGKYLLGLRYYHWSETVEFPTVKVDGVKIVEPQTIPAPPDINKFYHTLIQRKNFIHVCLNYYVFPLLRFKGWLPQSFVKNVFLPVPNPETKFYYGALIAGESLEFQLEETLLKTHDIYFSLYSRECFPLDWYPIVEPKKATAPTPEKCFYIVRIHPKFSREENFVEDGVNIVVLRNS